MKNYTKIAISLLFFLISAMGIQAQSSLTIGTGTSTNINLPINPYYGYSYSQSIFTSSQLGGGKVLDTIYYYFVGNGWSTPDAVKIYMGHTTKTAFSSTTDWVSISSLTEVYNATTLAPTANQGWVKFVLSTPFTYNGSDNLIIAFEENTGGYHSSNDDFYCTSSTGYSSIYFYNDGINPDPASPPSGNLSAYLPNIKLEYSSQDTMSYDTLLVEPPSSNIAAKGNPNVVATANVVTNGGLNPLAISDLYFNTTGTTSLSDIDSAKVFYTGNSNQLNTSYPFGTTITNLSSVLHFSGNMNLNSGNNRFQLVFYVNGNATDGNSIDAGLNSAKVNNISRTPAVANPSGSLTVMGTLSGSYTIGPDPSDNFSSFNQAVNSMILLGISGPVEFVVDTGIYTEQVTIPNINGSSAVNTITFVSATHNADDVTLQYSVINTSQNYTVQLNGAKYVTFKDMSISALNSGIGTAVEIVNNADYNQFRGNKINSLGTSSYNKGIFINNGASSFNKIVDNTISGGYYGIYFYASYSNRGIGNIVDSNDISNFYYYGFVAYYQDSLFVTHNHIHDNTNSYSYGMYLYYVFNGFSISSNKVELDVTSSATGIRCYYLNYANVMPNAQAGLVSNNMVSIINGQGTSYGLYAYYSNNVNYYNNSILINDNNYGSRALYQYNNTTNTIGQRFKNNVFANLGAGYAAYYGNTTQVNAVDYNNYYSKGSNFVYWNGDKADIAALKAASGKDSSSISVDPVFNSNTDLHASAIALNGTGTVLAEVTHDIDGESRSSTPDIGADEFTPPPYNIHVHDIYSNFQGDCNMPSNAPLYVEIINQGTAAATNFPVSYVLNNGTAVTQTYTGSIPSGDTAQFLFNTLLDLSTPGSYHLMVYSALSGDANKNNDTLKTDFEGYSSIQNLPFYEGFESGMSYFFKVQNNSQSDVYVDANSGYNSAKALYFEGGDYAGWNYYGLDPFQQMNQNSDHYAYAQTCNLDLSNVSALKMSFMLEMNITGLYNSIFFLTINDSIIVKDSNGDSTWTSTNGFESKTFDLSAFAGDTIGIKFNAVLRYNAQSYGYADMVVIDDVRIWEPKNIDVGVVNIEGSSQTDCGLISDSIFVEIKNFGLQTQSNIPAKLVGSYGSTSYNWSATYTQSIAPNQSALLFMGLLNTTQNGQIDIDAYTNLSTDEERNNDTLTINMYNSVYDTLPFTDPINNDDNWNYNNFVHQYVNGNGFFEYSGGEYNMAPNQIPQINFNLVSAFLERNKPIGPILANSQLIVDFKLYQNYGTADTIVIVISSDCGQTYHRLASLDINNVTPTYQNQSLIFPLGAYAGQKIKVGFAYMDDYSSDFPFLLDAISVIEPITVNLGNDTALCYGETLTLNSGYTASNGYHFMWSGPGLSTSDTLSTITASQSGQYVVGVYDPVGVWVYDTLNLMIYPAITAQVNVQNDTLCYGDSTLVNFNINGNYPIAFSWNDGAQTFMDTAYGSNLQKFLSPTTTSQYVILSVTDSSSCGGTNLDTFNIHVNPLSSLSVAGLNTQYCFNDSASTLTAIPSGGQFMGNGMAGNVFNPSMAGAGMHEIIYYYQDSNYCVNYDTLNTMVYNNPVVSIVSPLDSIICTNSLPTPMYAFPQGGSFMGQAMMNNTFNPALVGLGSQQVVYSYTDANNCSNSDTITTQIVGAPVVQFSSGLQTAFCSIDSTMTLSASPSGGSFVGLGVSGASFDPAVVHNGTSQIVYTYADANACENSDTLNVVVHANPTANIVSSLAPGYCYGSPAVALNATPSGGLFSGDGILGNSFIADSAAAGSASIVYTYTDLNGCIDSDTIQTQVYANPVVTFSPMADVCQSQTSVTLNGGSPTGGNYSGWGVGSITGEFFPAIVSVGLNQINYTYQDANGCSSTATQNIRVIGTPNPSFALSSTSCKSDTVNIQYSNTVSANASFQWSFNNPNYISGSAEGPYDLVWDTAGVKVVSLVVTDSGCTSLPYQAFTNVLDAFAVVSAVGNGTACYGDSVLMFANSGPNYAYQWYDTSGILPNHTQSSFNATQSGLYYAKVTNNFGCSAISSPVQATVFPQIGSNFTMPISACKDEMVSIQYAGVVDSTAMYNWNFDGGVVASGSAGGPYSIIWGQDSIKNVSLVVQKGFCFSDPTTKPIQIKTTPAIVTPLGNTTFCDGGSVTLVPNSGPNYSYHWKKDGQFISNTTGLLIANTSGYYAVEVTDNNLGCQSTSDSIPVLVNSTDFNLAFSANQTNFTIPPFIVTMNNQTVDTTQYYWAWSMGDGNNYTVANPQHQYQYDGTYTVGVIAQNINTGCFDTLVKNNYISCSGGSTNPCTLVASISPTGGQSICPGDSLLLTGTPNAGATYKWLKDGVLIPGADTTIFYAKTPGLYQIMVTDNICSQFSQPFSLSNYTTIQPVIAANGSIMPCTNDSMELYVTTFYNGFAWSNGESSQSIFVKGSGNYTVTTTDVNGCKTTSAPYIVNSSLLSTPEICIVGVDSATNSNFVVWERQNNPLIDSFKVYRESTVAGVYNLIGSKSAQDPGILLDVNSNPRVQAYRYKITAVDSCGQETPPSNLHKTIHLSINAGLNGSWNLIWSHYEGFNFGSYRIYRGADSSALQPLTQIQSTLNSYTDLTPPNGKVYYQIEVVSPHPCYPDSVYTKAKTNYNTSRSNNVNTTMVPNTGITEQTANSFNTTLYPNPNKGKFNLDIYAIQAGEYKIQVVDMLGQVLYAKDNIAVHGNRNLAMDLSSLKAAIYYIVVENNNERIVKKLIIN